MAGSKKASNGCRPQQFLGLWAVEPTRFRDLEAQAREALRSGLIKPPAAQLHAQVFDDEPMPAKPKAPPYRVLRGVAVIEIVGPLTKYETSFMEIFGGTSSLRAREAIRAAVRDPGIRGILLRIDSPGGTVDGTSDLAEAVKDANAKKPVFAYIEDCGCSAAYWVASQARSIKSNATAIVGSIGTFAVVWDSSGRYAEAGIRVHVISSAPLKGAGTAGAPVTDEMLTDWQREITELNDVFVAGVAKGRKMPIATARELADGRCHVGTNAQKLGLIDGVASFDATLKELEKATMDKDTLDLAAEAEERAVAAERQLTDVRAQLEAATKENADLKAQLAAKAKADAEAADPLASLDPQARAIVEAAQNEAAAAQRAVAEMRAENRRREFELKAASFKALPIQTAVFGAVLMEVADKLTPASATELDRVLRAADKIASTVDETDRPAMGEAGAGGDAGAASASDVVEARAKSILAEGKAKDIHQARDMAWKENPRLYKQHMKERRAS